MKALLVFSSLILKIYAAPGQVPAPTTEIFNSKYVRISWDSPSDNGNPISAYSVLI